MAGPRRQQRRQWLPVEDSPASLPPAKLARGGPPLPPGLVASSSSASSSSTAPSPRLSGCGGCGGRPSPLLASPSAGLPGGGGPPPSGAQVAAWVPTDRIGDVLGLRGSIVQRIKMLSGAQSVHLQEEAGSVMTPVQAVGRPDAVAQVRRLVQAVLEGRYDAIGFVKQVMEVPAALKASAAGPIDPVLKRISSATGALVQQPDPSGPLTVTGTPEAAARAREMLLAGGAGAEDGGVVGGGGAEEASAPSSLPGGGGGAAAAPGGAGMPGGLAGAGAGAAALRAGAGLGLPTAAAGAAGLPGGRGVGVVGHAPGARPTALPMVPPAGLGPSASGGQILTASFEIQAARVKDVLGVKGRNIKAIKQRSLIQKIAINDKSSDPATVTVTGTGAAIEKCKFMVLSIASGDQSVIGNVVDTMEIDQRFVSKFIGPKGQVISQIKDASGAYLEVREVGVGQPRIIMTGPPDSVARARDLIIQFLATQGLPPALLSSTAASAAGGSAAAAAATAALAAAAATAAADPYTQYVAQARLQEAQIHAQLQEASLQAQLQEASNMQDASNLQLQALAAASLQAQLAAQSAVAALGGAGAGGEGGGLVQELQALHALIAAQQRQSQETQQGLQADVMQLLRMASGPSAGAGDLAEAALPPASAASAPMSLAAMAAAAAAATGGAAAGGLTGGIGGSEGSAGDLLSSMAGPGASGGCGGLRLSGPAQSMLTALEAMQRAQEWTSR